MQIQKSLESNCCLKKILCRSVQPRGRRRNYIPLWNELFQELHNAVRKLREKKKTAMDRCVGSPDQQNKDPSDSFLFRNSHGKDHSEAWRQNTTPSRNTYEMAPKGIRKLVLLKNLAGTHWGANSMIIKTVYTGAVRPTLECGAKTHTNELDRVQNIGLRTILGAMKSTPISMMGKTPSRSWVSWAQKTGKASHPCWKDEEAARPSTAQKVSGPHQE